MHPLDNPIWTALTTSLAHLAESKGFARRFPADVSVLGAVFPPTDQAYNSLAQISGANPSRPVPARACTVARRLDGNKLGPAFADGL